ncbi:MAG: pyruvate-ferredoxin/flavodoxin oxidoreductase [Verrucomicrobiales bacterium]|jgi:pyruvate-ferredoxin/flavodoxin oxidoreductase
MLIRLNQDDVIYRRVFDPEHRSFVPDFQVYIKAEINGKMTWLTVSRQMVLFAVERRKCWRMLQSRAGIVNLDYLAQKNLLGEGRQRRGLRRRPPHEDAWVNRRGVGCG